MFASKAKINVFTFLDSCSNGMERPQTGQESKKEITINVDFMSLSLGVIVQPRVNTFAIALFFYMLEHCDGVRGETQRWDA